MGVPSSDAPRMEDDTMEDGDTAITTALSISPFAKKREADFPCLVVLTGTNPGEVFQIRQPEVIIGRGPTSDIRLPDDAVSRKHARITSQSGHVLIEDLGSANGTLVNGEPVTTRSLVEGDKIQIGPKIIVKFTRDAVEESFQRQMYDAALRDGLTRAFNKKYFQSRLESEVAYSRRHRTELSLVLFDVDHFKKVNDTYGHPAGDAVLVRLAKLAMGVIRQEDVFARYGGEEFAILCRGVTRDGAFTCAERLRTAVEQAEIEFDTLRLAVTVSLGVAGTPTNAFQDGGELVLMADEALYEAKRSGRNRVVRKD